jgi:cobalamin synthase
VDEKKGPQPEKIRTPGDGFGLLKCIMRADLIFCFVVIPLSIFAGWFFGINPLVTIPLVAIVAVIFIACLRGVRHLR